MRTRRRRSRDAAATGGPIVLVHADVVEESVRLVRTHPDVEVGGKLVGFLAGSGTADGSPWGSVPPAVAVCGTIGSGPGARATATSLHPDGPFQDATFRRIEAAHPDVEHLGSWHSHHPNGLASFSTADVDHYTTVVRREDHNLDLFVAGLCVDGRGLAEGRFELFLRHGRNRRHVLGPGEVRIVDDITSLQPEIMAIEAALAEPRPEPAPEPEPASRPVGREVAQAIEAGLVDRLGATVGRVDEADAITWIIPPAHAGGPMATVTYTGGGPGSAAISATVRNAGVTVDLDAVAGPEMVAAQVGLLDLTRQLLEVVDRVEHGRRERPV